MKKSGRDIGKNERTCKLNMAEMGYFIEFMNEFMDAEEEVTYGVVRELVSRCFFIESHYF